MSTYTIKTGDILLCDINTTISGGVITIPTYNTYQGGLVFNFGTGADVQKQLDKSIYVIRKPGLPVGYEIGLGERIFNITSTIKNLTTGSDANYTSGLFRSLVDLNYLCNFQYNKVITTGSKPSYGVLNMFYIGDGGITTSEFYNVLVRNLWYEQKPGGGKIFDIRISLSQVILPGT